MLGIGLNLSSSTVKNTRKQTLYTSVLDTADLSGGTWTKTSTTATLTATDRDGNSNAATILTASAANGLIRRTLVSANALRRTTLYVKRRTGTGNVFLSQDFPAGSEIMPNGDFASSDVSAWQRGTGSVNGTLAVVGGALTLTKGAGDSGGAPWTLPITCVVGRLYKVVLGSLSGTSADRRFGIGTSANGIVISPQIFTAGTIYFVASSTTMYVVIANAGASGTTTVIDNVSIVGVTEKQITVTDSYVQQISNEETLANPTILIRLATSGDAIDIDDLSHGTEAL